MIRRAAGALAGLLLLCGCDRQQPLPDLGRVASATVEAPSPANFVTEEARPAFYAGIALVKQPWIKAPSVTDARDGLGPLFNAASCLACHPKGGRGAAAEENQDVTATLARLANASLEPDPVYGDQLQTRSISLADSLGLPPEQGPADEPPPEGKLRITWREEPFTYADGTTVQLRRPEPRIEQLGWGALSEATIISLRHAPPLWGLGLLDRIPEASLIAAAASRRDGISGRVAGRHGWKAVQPNLKSQVAAAAHADIGLMNPLHPSTTCTSAQTQCLSQASGADNDGFELPEALLDSMVTANDAIGVPVPPSLDEEVVARGSTLFARVGCDACHTPIQRTGVDVLPQLSEQEFAPFTDLLLHELGAGLSDARGEGSAEAAEWRTPPLWGIGAGMSSGLLHDGRARSVEEAILWHGGEAEAARNRFAKLNATERSALLTFLNSL
ncbi:MAG: di-heme oxidoredictase family protein [Archangium sp.]